MITAEARGGLPLRDGWQNDALRPSYVLAITPLLDGGTHTHALSAAVKHAMNGQGLGGPHAGLHCLADAFRAVIVDSKEVVGRRRRHRYGVRRRRPQGQRSPLWPQWVAAWSPVPRSGTLECATSRPSKLF